MENHVWISCKSYNEIKSVPLLCRLRRWNRLERRNTADLMEQRLEEIRSYKAEIKSFKETLEAIGIKPDKETELADVATQTKIVKVEKKLSKCPLDNGQCSSYKYESRDSLVRHLKEKHENDPGLEDAIKAVPKDPKNQCQWCMEFKSNLRAHGPVCKKNPEARANPDGAQGGNESTPNEGFIKAFKDRLKTHYPNLKPSVIGDYALYLKRMISHRVEQDASFSAWNWVQPGPEWQRVGPYMEYVKKLQLTKKVSCKKKLSSAHAKLTEWQKEALHRDSDDPLTQVLQDASTRRLSKA